MSVKRMPCQRCLRMQCLCHRVVQISNSIPLLIIQHPLELTHPKGSGRLLQLSLQQSSLISGETFDENDLRAALFADDAEAALAETVLLYPDTSLDQSEDAVQEPLHFWPDDCRPQRLVVIDATWRKSRKILYANPLLQKLPRLSLTDVETGSYRIRKAHREGQLSTLEASVLALSRWDGAAAYAPLLSAFSGLMQDYEDNLLAQKNKKALT